MILRHLAHAIGEQNWFTVALEVAIVVVWAGVANAGALSGTHKSDQAEKLDLGAMREPPPEYMSLVPHETLCCSQEFLLGLSLLTDFYESSVYNFEA